MVYVASDNDKPQRVTSVAELLHHSNGADKRDHSSDDDQSTEVVMNGDKDEKDELEAAMEDQSNGDEGAKKKMNKTGSCLSGECIKPKRKRRRVPVSCNVCRQRKLKCDRQHPCGSCKQLRLTHVCKFESRATYFDDNGQKTALKTPSNFPSLNLVPGDFGDRLLADAGGGDAAPGSGSDSIVDIARASLEDSLKANGEYYAQSKIEQIYKSMLQHSAANGTNRFIPCCGSQCSIDDPLFLDYLRAVKLTNLDTVSKFKSPELVVQNDSDPFAQTLQTLTPESALEDSSKWNNMLVHFPAYEVCEYMREVFLTTFNGVFRGFTAYSLRKDVDDARQIYLRYVLETRQSNESSSGQGFRMTMPEVHTVSLVLLIIHLARLTLPDDWTSKEIPGVEDDIYLGDSLRQLALAVVQATDIELENNLRFVQLVMCLTIYQRALIGECDRFGSYTDPDLVSVLIRSALINGLHRDPNKYDRIDVTESALRRHLWRQVLFLDALQALEVVRPMQLNLSLSDTSLDTYEGTELQKPWEMSQFMTQWSLIARRTLDMVILTPHSQVAQYTLDRIEQAIFNLEPGTNMSEENQLLCRALRLSLQMKFQQATAVDSTAEVTMTAIEMLLVQEAILRKCNYIGSSLSMRLATSGWYTTGAALIYPTADLQRALNESECDNETPADVVRLLQRAYETIRENSWRSYYLWRAHMYMNSSLVCLKAASSGKSDLTAAISFTECMPPKHAKWLDYMIKEMSREGSSLYIRDKKQDM